MAKKSQAQKSTASGMETLREGVEEAGKALTKDWGDDFFRQLFGGSLSSSAETPTKEHAPKNPNKGVIFDAAHHKSGKAELANAKHGEKMGAKPESRIAAAIDYGAEIRRSSGGT